MHNFTTQDFFTIFNNIKKFSTTSGDDGITRLAFSEQDQLAHQYVIDELKKYGLIITQDSIGNVFARLPGKNSNLPAVAIGSHIDSVPNGGAYDGVLGVCAGIYAILQHQPQQLERDLELIIFRCEESSRFACSCVGSKTLTGNVDNEKWLKNLDDDGLNVFQVVKQIYPQADFNACELDNNRYSAFLELHIEQGRVLEQQQKTIGIVHGIAAPTRFEVDVLGNADHSGATPMNIRSDALVASADIIKSINVSACRESLNGTVATVGKLNCYPNSMNVIPGRCKFYVDIRGINKTSINQVALDFKSAVAKAASDYHASIDIRPISQEDPVELNADVCKILEQQCQKLNYTYINMLSGAGHDSMYMAQKYPTAMVFIPSKDGISHNPAEFSNDDDMLCAANLLAFSLAQLANQV